MAAYMERRLRKIARELLAENFERSRGGSWVSKKQIRREMETVVGCIVELVVETLIQHLSPGAERKRKPELVRRAFLKNGLRSTG